MFGPGSGSMKIIVQDIPVWLPEPGYIYNHNTGKFEKKKIQKYSGNCFQRQGYPEWWPQKHEQELAKQQQDPTFLDGDCEEYRQRQWHNRLYGIWFYNNKVPTYITGLNWMYLEWWWLGKQYPDYRNSNREYFYMLQWAIECPFCYGLIDLANRQSGKTARSGLFIYEYCSRTIGSYGSIQSKSLEEARDTVYRRAILNAFLRLPDYFKPVYDTSTRLNTGMSFRNTIVMGKDQHKSLDTISLGSHIGYEDSTETACDGKTLDRYVGDEIFKTKYVDIRERHEVILPMLSPNGVITGKALYTSTVEDMETKNELGLQMWKDSDQGQVDIENGEMTATGLIRHYSPAYENYRCDKWGMANIEANKEYFLSERKKRSRNLKTLNEYIRKYSFTWQEAFRFSNTTTIFNSITIADALDNITFRTNELLRRGNFQWEQKDKKTVWVDDVEGPIQTVYLLEEHKDRLGICEKGMRRPMNQHLLDFGVDPFDHYKDARYKRYSDGAGLLKMKFQAARENKYYNDCFILQYLFRPDSPFEFFEDMIKICFFFSVPMLYEDQADGIRFHFEDRGYGNFLQWLPGSPKPGVSASQKVKENMVLLYKKHFLENKTRHYFKELLEQMSGFDITDTLKSDAVMAGGYALVSEDSYHVKGVNSTPEQRKVVQQTLIKSPILKRYKIRSW